MSKKLIATFNHCKVYFDSEWAEYRITGLERKAEGIYFTDDRDDAIATAKLINEKIIEGRAA